MDATAIGNALQGGNPTRVVLSVAGVEIPETRDYYVRVFVEKPDATEQSSIDDPHYAGSFGFFYDEAAMKHHGIELPPGQRPKVGYLVDVTPMLQKLNQAGSMQPQVNVTLLPVAYEGRQSTGHLTLERLELSVVRFGEQAR